MIVFDLTLATRSRHLTGVERYGINLFEAWGTQESSIIALVCSTDKVASKRVRKLKFPPIISWFLAPFLIPRDTKVILFPSFPPSPLFLFTSYALLRIIHDTVPWDFSSTMSLRGRLIFRDLENLFLFRYRQVLCPTSVAAEGLRARFPKLKTLICGNAPGIDVEAPEREKPPVSFEAGTYLLSVGTIEPRKNYEHLIELVAQSGLKHLHLVIVGREGWGGIGERISRRIAAGEQITWLSEVTDAELRWLYANCAAFISLSLAEGFNMPLVEAGCFGSPALASNLDIHVAVASAWTVYLKPSSSVEVFVRKLDIALGSRPALPEVLRYRERFSWTGIVARIRAAAPFLSEVGG